jgi:hypothetical protein
VVALAAVVSGCGGGIGTAEPAAAARPTAVAGACTAAWRSGWQKLANRIDAPVYCPTWMPNPLDAQIGGQWSDIDSVGKDRSYLISFLSHDQSGDVHVNFRGYPGRTRIPTCGTVDVEGGTVRRGHVACFASPHGTRRAPGIVATVYTVNQDADQWHVLYAWRRFGSLYTVSEHVIRPLTYRQVVRNLDRLLRSLVVVRPQS